MFAFYVERTHMYFLIQIGVKIVRDKVHWMNGSWDAYVAPPTDFAGAEDINTNLAKERERGIKIIKCTPLSLIIISN